MIQANHPFTRPALSVAVLLALAGGAQAQSAKQQKKELDALRAQVSSLTRLAQPNADAIAALQQQVSELKALLAKQNPPALPGNAAANTTVNIGNSPPQPCARYPRR